MKTDTDSDDRPVLEVTEEMVRAGMQVYMKFNDDPRLPMHDDEAPEMLKLAFVAMLKQRPELLD